MNSIESPTIKHVSHWLAKRVGIICFAFILTFSRAECHGQGTFHITFDGPPMPTTITFDGTAYFESGLYFSPSTSTFQRIAPGSLFGPYNGTAYITGGRASALGFSFTNGSLLSLASVDLAEQDISVTPRPATVSFIGYRFDGTTVTTNFTTDGIIDRTGPLADFQTFHFDSRFNDLTRIEIPNTGWSMDNLMVISVVPEPSALTLLCCSAFMLATRCFRIRPVWKQRNHSKVLNA
jgi:hypothetical protein